MQYQIKTMIQKLLYFFLFFSFHFCDGQNVISGTVSNTLGKPLESANILVYQIETGNIVAFGISDKQGFFMISFESSKNDSLKLVASCLGYNYTTRIIKTEKSQKINFSLDPGATDLPEITVNSKPKPISGQGDTITYNTRSFVDSSDRVIIDVIKKLPGITVTQTGQILYNNRAINKFYVEGKDLLADRYNIASNNLPSSDVIQVQILQNHQPIKVLENDIFSDRAAINIVLDKSSKSRMLMNGNVGIGASPTVDDNNLSLLKFKPNLQYINSFKHNTVGIDLDRELKEQNQTSNILETGLTEDAQTSVLKTSPPPIEQPRYLLNNNSLLNSNYLFTIQQKYDVRINVALENDMTVSNPNSNTTIFLPSDTIIVPEKHTGISSFNKLFTEIDLQRNSSDFFLENSLMIVTSWNKETDNINPISIDQISKNNYVKLTNTFTTIKKTKHSGTISFKSYTLFSDNPEQLSLYPGLYAGLLNNGGNMDGLLQKVHLKNIFTDNNATFGWRWHKVSATNTVGGTIQNQQLSNSLKLLKQGQQYDPSGRFQNDIIRNRLKLYNETSINYFSDRFKCSFSVKHNFTYISNKAFDTSDVINRFYIEPEARLQLNINNYWNANITGSMTRYLINDGNSSLILSNYRSLINNDIPVRDSKNKYISLQIGYRNLVRALFFNVSIDHSNTLTNILIENIYDSFLTKRKAIYLDNASKNTNLKFSISKYYDNIKTIFNVSTGYNISQSFVIQQGILTSIINNSFLLETIINKRFKGAASINHSFTLNIDNSSTEQNSNLRKFNPLYYLKQNLSVSLFLKDGLQTKLNVEQYFTKIEKQDKNDYYFLDFIILQKLKKTKTDLSLSLINLLNSKSYTSYSYLNNILISSNYPLRNRMILLKFGFQL